MTEKGSLVLGGFPSNEQRKESQTSDTRPHRSVLDAEDVVARSILKEDVSDSAGLVLPVDLIDVEVPKQAVLSADFIISKESKDILCDSQQPMVLEQHNRIVKPSTCYESSDERFKKMNSERDDLQARRNDIPQTYAIQLSTENDATPIPSQIIVTSTPDSVTSNTLGNEKTGRLRRGKWTVEEEAYVARVIQDFNSGYLDAPAGTTLRTYLSEKLQCDPMRITKKFTGDHCIGKRVFHPAVRSPNNASSIDKAQAELLNLENRWQRRLESQQRESAKKITATAAAAAATVERLDDNPLTPKNTTVVETAAWLDRARSLLEDPSNENAPSNDDMSTSLENQMKEVQRLIHEGPVIQENTSGFGTLTDQSDDQGTASSGSDNEPADKRLRTAEDAEALVGFIRTVRAYAASGEET